jgi:indole-3-glycerol phosphate synthase
MPNILNEIVAHKKLEIKEQKNKYPQELLERQICLGDGSFLKTVRQPQPKIIAEIKPKSPSGGILSADFLLRGILAVYNKHASAISVLTDTKYFGGSLDLLKEVAKNSPHPVLCKDFVLDPYQCFAARHAGAQAVLLIVKILDDRQLEEIYLTIKQLGMTPAVEIQNESELERCLKLEPEVILINNRNLESFIIQLDTTKKLVPLIPKTISIISASGIQSRDDIEELIPYCSNFLIGSVLMRANNIEDQLKILLSETVCKPV